MYGATVFEAGQNFIRVSWDDGFNSGAFKFNFDMPLSAIPKVGQKVSINGTYSSYSRELFQINLVGKFIILVYGFPSIISFSSSALKKRILEGSSPRHTFRESITAHKSAQVPVMRLSWNATAFVGTNTKTGVTSG
jgi:hypothetical protein